MTERRPIGVVVKTYPKLSETFILEELLALERQGLDLRILSLHRPTDDRTNAETADVEAPVAYPPSHWGQMVGDHARVIVRHPIGYSRMIGHALRHRERGWPANLVNAGWLAAEAKRAGLSRFHVHFLSEPTSVVDLASTATGIGFSASAHAKDIYLTEPSELKRKLKAARFTVTCTEHNRAYLARLVGPQGDNVSAVECVHHGVVLDRFVPPPTRDGGPIILAVGRLRAKKGFDTLIEACAQLRDANRPIECRIVGYGPEESALRAEIDRLGLGEHVELLGKLTRAEVIDQYRQATVLAQPCRITDDGDRDGIPNVLLEAMAMELPVIATPVSGIPELIEHDTNGVLVPPEDPAALAAAIGCLFDDDERRRRLGVQGRRTVEVSFTADRSAAAIAAKLDPATVAYVVKGYPRLSELFIATEIYRVERLGLPLQLFVLKPQDEPGRHGVVNQIRVTPRYLPGTTSISKRSTGRWLGENLVNYYRPLLRVARRRPIGLARAANHALAQAQRARTGRWPRKVYLKEFLQAATIADGVLADPDVRHLHAHFSHGATTVTWLAAMMAGRTFSFTAHAKDIYLDELNPAGLLVRKLEAATFVTTCTEANHDHLANLAPNASIHTVYHGLNEEFAELVAANANELRSASSDHPFTVLAVGRLVPKKGLDLLVTATVELVDSGIDVQIRIVGEDGPHRSVIEELIETNGLRDRVTLLGPMDQRQLFDEFRAADVFCLPCRVLDDGDRDGIPNVLVEAMAAGLPVVSTPISGIPELIEDRANGLLVNPESSAAVAKALLELNADPDLRVRLAAAGQETVRAHFEGWSCTKELVALLADAAGTAPRSTRP